MWYLIVSIPDLCTLTNFVQRKSILMSVPEYILHVVFSKIGSFWNLSFHASNHGNHFKTSGQLSFKNMFSLLGNKCYYFPLLLKQVMPPNGYVCDV